LLDVSRVRNLGWQAEIPLNEGIRRTYQWYVEQRENRLPLTLATGDAMTCNVATRGGL